jgi:hypothetical protein
VKYRFNRALIPRLVCFGLGILIAPFSMWIGGGMVCLSIVDTLINPVGPKELDYTAMGLPEPSDRPLSQYLLRLAILPVVILVPFTCMIIVALLTGWLMR